MDVAWGCVNIINIILLFVYITTRVVYTSPYQDTLLWGNPATVHKHMENFDPKIGVILAGIVVPDPQGM